MKRIAIISAILLLLTSSFTNAQGRKDKYEYGTELIWGANKNTAGGLIGGIILRKSKKISDRMFESIGVELVNIKHGKETRWNSTRTGNFFIFGKQNYFYSIRAQYGRELILFNKSSDQGVEIKFNAAVGPSFGLQNPYYVEVALDSRGFNTITYKVPYETSISYNSIYGPGNLFQGLGETTLKMGLNTKASLSFEMGTLKTHVTGFEVGVLLDAYASEIEIMANAQNRSVFPTAFISLFYGTRK